jgi:hypothetical protein
LAFFLFFLGGIQINLSGCSAERCARAIKNRAQVWFGGIACGIHSLGSCRQLPNYVGNEYRAASADAKSTRPPPLSLCRSRLLTLSLPPPSRIAAQK